MKIIAARVRWMEHYSNHPEFELLVDKIPDFSDVKHRMVKQRGSRTVVWGEKEGMVHFFVHNSNDQSGYGGSVFKAKDERGVEHEFRGPWSSGTHYMNNHFPHSMEVAVAELNKDGTEANWRPCIGSKLLMSSENLQTLHSKSGCWIVKYSSFEGEAVMYMPCLRDSLPKAAGENGMLWTIVMPDWPNNIERLEDWRRKAAAFGYVEPEKFDAERDAQWFDTKRRNAALGRRSLGSLRDE